MAWGTSHTTSRQEWRRLRPDYVELTATQTSGGNLDTLGGVGNTWFRGRPTWGEAADTR